MDVFGFFTYSSEIEVRQRLFGCDEAPRMRETQLRAPICLGGNDNNPIDHSKCGRSSILFHIFQFARKRPWFAPSESLASADVTVEALGLSVLELASV